VHNVDVPLATVLQRAGRGGFAVHQLLVVEVIMQGKVLEFRSTYRAALKEILASGFQFKIAGTLDGFVDLAVTESDGSHRTYNISSSEARQLADALLFVVEDIGKNCLYDRDALIVKDGRTVHRPSGPAKTS
jgi:hypothetical protein